jgi:hypothetical protein
MAWLPIYATTVDFDWLRELLAVDGEIAFVVADGPRRWRATLTIDKLPPGRHCLWHVPSGPLPLLNRAADAPPAHVPDPWRGWAELRTGVDPTTPYFGPGHPGIVWLNARVESHPNCVALSSFEWIGNWYSIIGSPAPKVTEKWWQSLRRRIRKVATHVPRGGPGASTPPEIYALPDAQHKFEVGWFGGNN